MYSIRLYRWLRSRMQLPSDPAIASDAVPRLERLLLENLVPFWSPAVIDRRAGGYRLYHENGEWRDPPYRHIVGQAETLWFFAKLAGSPYGTADHLAAARHGFDFLTEKMWDKDHGGFYWAVDDGGNPVLEPKRDDHRADIKHMLGQSFALFGLSQYALASGDAEARKSADRLFDLIETHTRDREWGGVVEVLSRDWSPAPAGIRNVHHGGLPTDKGFSTQIHLLEALAPYVALTGDPRARRLLTETLTAGLASVATGVPLGHIASTMRRDWVPRGREKGQFIKYGHELEMATLLIEACRSLDLPLGILSGRLRRTLTMTMRGGFDRRAGGFHSEGRPWFRAADRVKNEWTQAEALLCCLWIHRITGDEVAAHAFNRTLDWIDSRQADWEDGGWHNKIQPDGRATGRKAWDWHTPYHSGRALIDSLALLKDDPRGA